MEDESARRATAYEFVLEHVDTVPQLEALLLLWNSRPRAWSVAEVAERLYIQADTVKAILDDLCHRGLLTCEEQNYFYSSAAQDQARTLEAVDETYRREIVTLSSMIHSKASRAVRDFARAFRFKKERD